MRRFQSFMLYVLILIMAVGSISTVAAQVVDLEEEWPILYHALAYEFASGGKRPYDEASMTLDSDKNPVDILIRRTEAMLDDYARFENLTIDLATCRSELEALKKKAEGLSSTPKYKVPSLKAITVGKKDRYSDETPTQAGTMDMGDHKDVFIAAAKLNRKVALANPLMNMDKLVFVKKHPPRVGHMCDQWFGMVQDPGGGLFMLENPTSPDAKLINLTEDVKVASGARAGNELHQGIFASPEVTYDGEQIWFAYSASTRSFTERWEEAELRSEKEKKYRNAPWGGTMWNEEYFRTEDDAFNLFVINADGSNLRQITSGAEEDHSPCALPNGRICFVSTRRGGEGRCHPRPCPSYVLHTMLPDGSDITPLSYHEINEWTPRVNNDGKIVYSRWDYMDRQFADGQKPWIIMPDGRDSRDLYGNYESVFRGSVQEDLRAIPNTPLYVGVIHSHHSSDYGPLIIYDARESDTKEQPGVSYLTPLSQKSSYSSPYPLDDTYFLCVWSPDSPETTLNTWKWYHAPTPHGVYLIDKFGNKTLLYRDDEISCMGPVPVEPREKPPVLPHMVAEAYPPGVEPLKADPEKATFSVIDVYNSRFEWPEGRNIKALRIFQIYPKTTPRKGNPRISYNQEVNARGLIGTVPVEEDGSANFVIPSRVPVYLQALDENGLAIQSMRSSFYGMPGEHNTCLGCHDLRTESPVYNRTKVIALNRPPSVPEPGPEGSWPMAFGTLVQPVLEAKCNECHAKNKEAPRFSNPRSSHRTLKEWAWALNDKGQIMTRPKGEEVETSAVRSIPNKVGAFASRLYPLLTTGSHKDKVKLTDEEMERIVVWLDGFSVMYGAYENTTDQDMGKPVMPSLQ